MNSIAEHPHIMVLLLFLRVLAFYLSLTLLAIVLTGCTGADDAAPESHSIQLTQPVEASLLTRSRAAANSRAIKNSSFDMTVAIDSLNGRVFSASNGLPLDGAEVWVAEQDSKPYQTTDTIVASAITDSSGWFSLPTFNRTNYYIKASKKGYATVEYNNVSAAKMDFTFLLPSAAFVSGHVLDETSAPIANASILLSQRQDQSLHHFVSFRTETNSAGWFRAIGALQSTASISISSSFAGTNVTSTPIPKENAFFTLYRNSGSINGTAVDCESSTPLSGIDVVLHQGASFAHSTKIRETSTSVSGQFSFKSLSAGTFFIQLGQAREVSQPASKVEITSRETSKTVVLAFSPETKIVGKVFDVVTSQPISGVMMRVSSGGGNVNTAQDGSFTFDEVYHDGNGTVSITAEADSYELIGNSGDRRQHDVALRSCSRSQSVELLMHPFVNIRGIVVGENGVPLPSANVALEYLSENRSAPKSVAIQTGEFAFEAPPFSKIQVKAQAPGWAEEYSGPVQLEGRDISNIILRLTRATSVSGVVVTETGMPVPDAEVGLSYVKSPGVFRTTRTKGSGEFAFDNVPSKPVTIAAARAPYLPSRQLRVHPTMDNPARNLKLVLRQMHQIDGKVISSKGKNVQAARVAVLAPPPWTNGIATTDKQGKFSISGLPKGQYDLLVSSPGYKTVRRTGVSLEDKDLVIVLEQVGDFNFIVSVVDSAQAPVLGAAVSSRSGHSITEDLDKPGQFLVTGLTPGSLYRILITAPPYLPLDSAWRVAPKVAGATEFFEMGAGGGIKGRVVKQGTNQPIPNVAIEIVELNGDQLDLDVYPPSVSLSQLDGTFQLERVPPGTAGVAFLAESPPVEIKRYVSVSNGLISDLGTIELADSPSIQVRIVRDGMAVPNVRIALIDLHSSFHETSVSDGSGLCYFSELATGHYKVTATDYDVSKFVDIVSNEQAIVTLSVGRRKLSGRFLRGNIAARGSIRVSQPLIFREQRVYLDEGGYFEVVGLTPETWTVTFLSTEMPPIVPADLSFQVDLRDGDLNRNFYLPAGILRGRVVGSSGEGIGDCSVTVSRPPTIFNGFWDRERTATTLTDTSGKFVFVGFPGGPVAVSATKPSVGTVRVEGVTIPSEGATDDVLLRLGKGGTLVSTAINLTTGQPIPSSWCYIRNSSGLFNHNSQRDSKGVLRVDNIPPGLYTAEVSAYGFSVATREIQIEEDQQVEILDVLYEAGALRISTVNKFATRLPNVGCTLEPIASNSIQPVLQGKSDGRGELVLRGIHPGLYKLSGVTSDSLTASKNVEVVAHQPVSIVLEF